MFLYEIVFENRNKEFGAYFLRKKYTRHLSISLLICVSLVTAALTFPLIYKKYFVSVVPTNRKMVEIDLKAVEIPPLLPNNPSPPPPPMPSAPSPKVKTVRYLPPKISPDPEVKEDELLPDQDALRESVISNTTQDGEQDTLGINKLSDREGDNMAGLSGNTFEDNTIYLPGPGLAASFPGGVSAMNEYISRKVRPYAEKAAKLGDKGTVFLMFVIEKNGRITDVRVMKGLKVCTTCNDAVKDIVQNMPDWMPATSNGQPVRVRVQLPIVFDYTN